MSNSKYRFNPWTGKLSLIEGANGVGGSLFQGKVATFADLPDPTTLGGEIYAVEQNTGVIFINRQKSGLYISDGTQWTYLSSFTAEQVPYTNVNSALTATTVQSAIDELENEIDVTQTDIATLGVNQTIINETDPDVEIFGKDLVLGVGTNERVRIKHDGTVGSAAELQFNGNGSMSADNNLYFQIDTSNATTNSFFSFRKDAEGTIGSENLLTIQEDGDLVLSGYESTRDDGATNVDRVLSVTNSGRLQVGALDAATSGDITGLQTQIDSNDTDISNLQSEQTTQNAAIVLNTAKVGVSGNEILEGDARLTDARTPLAHTHTISEITDASTVAASNDYNDLNNLPTIPNANGNSPTMIPNSGRFYMYADTRWVTDSDDNYGINYYQMNESGLTGVNPVVEWEHLGMIVPKNRTLSRLLFLGRTNSLEVTDFEISIQMRIPNPLTRYQSGIDADAEMTNTEIYRSNFVEVGWTGNMADRRLKEINLGNLVVPEHAQVSIYIKPIGTLTATRYLTASWTWEII